MIRKDQLLGRGLALFLALGLVLTDLSPAAAIKAYAAEADAVETRMETEEVSEDADPSESGSVDLDAQGDGEKTLSKAVLALDTAALTNSLDTKLGAGKYEFSYVSETTTVPFKNADYKTDFETALKAGLKVSVDGEDKDTLPAQAKIAWKKGAEKAEAVTDAGSYTATISLAAQQDVCAAADDITVSFEVEKAEISIVPVKTTFTNAGITAKDVAEANKDATFQYADASDASGRIKADSLSVKVKDAYTGAVLAETDVLQKNADYVVELTAELKEDAAANYSITAAEERIQLTAAQPTEIKLTITTTTEDGIIAKDYDGKPLTVEDLAGKYTAKVFTKDVADPKELTGAELTGAWLDASKNELAEGEEPKNAGTWYYRLSYKDPNGTYATSTADIRADVNAVKLTVKPVLEEADMTVAADSYASDLVKKTSYKAVFEDGTEKTVAQLGEGFFGTWYDEKYNGSNAQNRTQGYQPLFRVQKISTTTKTIEGKTTVDIDIVNNDVTKFEVTPDQNPDENTVVKYSYRLVFSGEKAVFNSEGIATAADINSGSGNYTVDISDDTIAENAIALTLKETEKLTIDVSAIAGENSFGSPSVHVYDGSQLYANRGAYKKAVAGDKFRNADSRLVYTWEYLKKGMLKADNELFDQDGKAIDYDAPVAEVEDPGDKGTDEQNAAYKAYQAYSAWEQALASGSDDWSIWNVDSDSYEEGAVDSGAAPASPGVFRLEVELEDPTHTYTADPAFVYYVIQPKGAAVAELTGELKAYAGDTALQALARLQHDDPEDAGSYLGVAYHTAVLSDEDDKKKVTVTKGTALYSEYSWWDLLYWNDEEGKYKFNPGYLQIEKGTTAEGKTTWDSVADEYKLKKDETYRISLTQAGIDRINGKNDGSYIRDSYNREESATDYYTVSQKITDHCVVLDDSYYENIPVSLTVLETTPLKAELDESKFVTTSKMYDGQGVDTAEILSCVTLKKSDDTAAPEDAQQYLEVVFTEEASDLPGHITGKERGADANVHVGSYTVSISLKKGTDLYTMEPKTFTKKFTITKRPATLTPVVKEGIQAGEYIWEWVDDYYDDNKQDWVDVYEVVDLVESFIGEGFVDGDLTDVDDITFDARVNGTNESFEGECLRGDKEYYAVATGAVRSEGGQYSVSAEDWIARNYDVTYKPAGFTAERVSATVGKAADGTELSDAVGTSSDSVKFTHVITPLEGIPANSGNYAKDIYDIDNEWSGKNLFVVRINEPDEYMTNAYTETKRFHKNNSVFTFKNAIEKAGGKIVGPNSLKTTTSTYIDVAFDASAQSKKEFTILWEKDYAETFEIDMTGAVLESDLTEAVAPRSLSFNGANTKMVVGGTQQLDVSVSKVDMADVIYLTYSVDDTSVLQVRENGFVTALKKGSATVSAIPSRQVNGKAVPITGAKTATLKITVSDVAAPKLGTVTPGDTYVSYSYIVPEGYRREVYVLEGNVRAADFETKLAAVKNGDYSGFAAKSFTRSEGLDSKGYASSTAGDLTPDTQYTLYVRNVSGLRTLENGSIVASSAAGVVKSFKTSKAQLTWLYASLGVKWSNVYNSYVAALSDKTAQASVTGTFPHSYYAAYADRYDEFHAKLPLSASLKKYYTDPKLSWYVCSAEDARDDIEDLTEKEKAQYVELNDTYKYYKKTSALASVSSSGKLTFKGKGSVYVIVQDQLTGEYDMERLYITASPDSFSGKAISLKPGETKDVRTVLTYKQKNVTIADYNKLWADLTLTAESSEYFEINGSEITALKAGGKLDLTVSDETVKENGGSDIVLKVSSTAMDNVKSLKTVAVRDYYATVGFSYPVVNDDVSFRFKLTDSKKNVVFDRVKASNAEALHRTAAGNYTVDTTAFVDKLTLLSNYTLEVSAIYKGTMTKPVTLRFKTTNIPASYYNLAADAKITGTDVYVYRNADNFDNTHRLDKVVLKSGNTYVFYAPMEGAQDNKVARLRGTDTLTWKSTNNLVGTMKATAGSYSASFKATRPGYTKIELTSKITKCVIARYTLLVDAVGDGKGYFELNDPYGKTSNAYKNAVGYTAANDYEEQDMIAISADSYYKGEDTRRTGSYVKGGSAQWYVFTAPAFGDYTVTTSDALNTTYWMMRDGKLCAQDEKGIGYTKNLSNAPKGTKLYVKVVNPTRNRVYSYAYLSACTMKQELTLGANSVKGQAQEKATNLYFKAPEANVYTFSYKDNNGKEQKVTQALDAGGTYTPEVKTNVTVGKTYTLTISKRVVKGQLSASDSTVSIAKDAEVWYAFTAPATKANYKLTASSEKAYTAELFDTLKDIAVSTKDAAKTTGFSLNNGDTIYVRFTSTAATAEAPVSVTASIAAPEAN